MRSFLLFALFAILTAQICLAEKETEDDGDNDKKKITLDDSVGESVKGLGDWFKNAAEETVERSRDGMQTMKEFSNQAKEKSETGVESMKGFAESGAGAMKGFGEGISERFGKAKEKLQENGEKMKEAFSSAAERSKDEFETAASKISKHAKDASNIMFSMFSFNRK